MTSENLQRTSYRDPNTTTDQVRSGTPTLAENERDMDQYYRPLERIHGSNLHGWGVASGLSVTATLNSATLTVQPGVALDSKGQHIALAVGGNAEVGQNPTGFSTGATFKPVLANGVALPTSGLTGDKYLTMQFYETFDSDSYNSLGIFRYFHTPWLQLIDVASFTNDGNQVVLAKVSFGTGATAGQVTALSQDLRQATDLPTGSIHLQRNVQSTAAGNTTVAIVEAGVLQAYVSGGLDITVPNATDEVHLERDDGTNFAKVSLGAEKVVARQGNGTESVVIDTPTGGITASGPITGGSISTGGGVTASGTITTSGNIAANGTITSGTSGTNGEVSVNDAMGNPTIVLNGGIATVEIGNADSAGVLQILNTSGQATCSINGQNGKGVFTGILAQGTILGGNQLQSGWGVAGVNSGTGIGVHAANGGNTADLGTPNFAGDFQGNVSIAGDVVATSMQASNDAGFSTGINSYGRFIGVFSRGTFGIDAVNFNNQNGVLLATPNQAGWFDGDVHIVGNLSKSGGSFRIDHPLDPANKYLSHSFVESPDMKNFYDGVAVLDANGEAEIELPAWFETLNRDFRYQLTCIGGYAQVYIAEKVHNNRFKIAGGQPGLEVSWLVTGIRQDAWAKAHPIKVEEDKSPDEQGYYLHPELHGAPDEKDIRLALFPPEITQKM